MKKLALSASMLGAIALAACGGGDDGIVVPDGGGTDGGNVGICNPQTQAGCNPGEKCTALFPTTPGQPIVTGCVPDGSVDDGGACTRPMGNGDGSFSGGVDTMRGDGTLTDDCLAGLFCDSQGGADVCTPVCGLGAANTCPADAAGTPRDCVGISGIFDDLPMGSETGFCTPVCNPTVEASTCPGGAGCCAAGEGCYLIGFDSFICASPAMGSEMLNGLEECEPRNSAGLCFINSAPVASTMFFPAQWTTQGATGVITPYCIPVETHSTAPAPARGGAAPITCDAGGMNASGFGPDRALDANQGDCRFINSIFGNDELGAIDDTAGVCVPENDPFDEMTNVGWNDDPENWVIADFQNMMGPFCPGCAPRAMVFAAAAAPNRAQERVSLSEENLRKFVQSMGLSLEELRQARKEGRKIMPRNFPTQTTKK